MTTSAPERVLISSPAAQQSIPAGVPFPLAGVVFLQVGDVAGSPLGREGASPPASPVPGTTYLIDGVPAGAISFSSLAETVPSSPQVAATFNQLISISRLGSHTITVKATIAGATVTALVTVLITEGKGSNHNYILYSDCNPVTNLKVKIDVRKDLAGNSGFSFQLNAYSAVNNPLMCNFQQYILTLSNPPPITLNGFIEYWPLPNTSFGNLTNFNTSLFPPAGKAALPSFKIPGNSEFGMILKTDPNNRNAVTAVEWFVNDFPNQQNIMLPIKSQTPMTSIPLLRKSSKTQKEPTESPFLSQYLIPFVAFQLNLVGAQFESGHGRITYESTNALMVANTTAVLPCDNVETPSLFTGETGNVVYGQPMGTGNTLMQTFEVIT